MQPILILNTCFHRRRSNMIKFTHILPINIVTLIFNGLSRENYKHCSKLYLCIFTYLYYLNEPMDWSIIISITEPIVQGDLYDIYVWCTFYISVYGTTLILCKVCSLHSKDARDDNMALFIHFMVSLHLSDIFVCYYIHSNARENHLVQIKL
jgi:hypothetical protein